MKLKLELGGNPRPLFETTPEDRRMSVMQHELAQGLEAAREWQQFQRQEFPEFETSKNPSKLSTDKEVSSLMNDIRRLDRGHIDTRAYNSRDMASYVFSTPETTKDISTTKETISYSDQYTAECMQRCQEHNLLMDGFARYNEERMKFKSGRGKL